MDKETKKNFSKWLEILQQESWQLELIISGFAIFLLLGTLDPLADWNYQVSKLEAIDYNRPAQFLKIGIIVAFLAWYVLVINLEANYLPRGDHRIEVKSKFIFWWNNKDSVDFEQSALIPFWKE